MKIQSLRLKNFRCFEDVTIDFHKQLTVLVGVNGSGKTAVLEAVSMILEDILRAALPSHQPSYRLGTSDSLYNASEYASMHMQYESNGHMYDWVDPLVENKSSENSDEKNLNITINNIHYGANTNPEFTSQENLEKLGYKFPVMSLYTVHRLYIDIDFSIENSIDRNWSKAYENSFSPFLDFKKSVTWFYSEYARFAIEYLKNKNLSTNNELECVKEAVNKVLPGYNNPTFINNPPELVLTRQSDGQDIPFAHLSGGYRAMLALIFDLARRMAVANGKSERFARSGLPSLLHSPAIVLIDEVELHLHPSWQQTVLPSLMDIFPNTQFIVTTHSPQVVSSVEPQHVRILKDGKVLPVETSTFGAESSRVLEEVFGVLVRPQNDAIRALDKYLKLINDGEGHSAEAKALRAQLDNWLADDPILDRADMFITRSDRQKAREEKVRA